MSSNTDPEIIRHKQTAADAAVVQLEDGMIVGLGSGSTAELAVASIGRRVAAGLRIIGVPTSEKTAALARLHNIPLSTLGEHPQMDIAIDGADEVLLPGLSLIKGGGGNQLREKLVAISSRRLVIVVDERKLVGKLGTTFPVPVEVIRFGWESTAKRLEAIGAKPVLRYREGKPYITDDGNFILDCGFGLIDSPPGLQRLLDGTVGVVEHGLFIGIASQAIVAGTEGVRIFNA